MQAGFRRPELHKGSPMLVHSVYFWLQPELTPAQRAAFHCGLDSLRGIACVEQVWVGTPAAVTARPVVDKTYSFALTVLCRDLAAHDAYQRDPLHQAFLTQFKPYWSRVQIYDTE